MATLDELISQISLNNPNAQRDALGAPRYGDEVRRYDAFRDMFKLADAIVKYQKQADTVVPRGTPTLAAESSEFNNLLNLLGTTGRVSTPRQAELFGLEQGWQIPQPSLGVGGRVGGRGGSGIDTTGLPPEIAQQIMAQLGTNPDNKKIQAAIDTLNMYKAMGIVDATAADNTINYLYGLMETDSSRGNSSGNTVKQRLSNLVRDIGEYKAEQTKSMAGTLGKAAGSITAKLMDNPLVNFWSDQVRTIRSLFDR